MNKKPVRCRVLLPTGPSLSLTMCPSRQGWRAARKPSPVPPTFVWLFLSCLLRSHSAAKADTGRQMGQVDGKAATRSAPRKPKQGRPLLLLGCSETLGWGGTPNRKLHMLGSEIYVKPSPEGFPHTATQQGLADKSPQTTSPLRASFTWLPLKSSSRAM